MVDYSTEAVKAINEKVNELLLKCDNQSKNPAIDPSVDIMKIAKAYGVEDVQYVSPGLLDGKHAIFKNGVVMIDETDSNGQREFDLAHEVGHIVFKYITTHTAKTTRFKFVRKKTGELIIKPFIAEAVTKKAARQGASRKLRLPPGERKIELFLDRFAANLLVPIHRFQLWEDKTDKEIAKAFNVEEKCIKKRREEIKHELRVLTAKMKPCPTEDIVDPDVKLDIDALLEESTVINANR
jgi:Zn-dependent peptidase ImmA (M78 family)